MKNLHGSCLFKKKKGYVSTVKTSVELKATFTLTLT